MTDLGASAPIPAAQYVRMSTEHQRYSADNQAAAIELYAAAHGYEVVQTYADLGKSGLTLEKRPALQQLLADVQGGSASYKAVLVYDVSRWGRFQDPDEAAAYELACKRAGVAVHYCAEVFDNDGSIAANILKTIKRIMAAEYSRELGEKMHASRHRIASQGYVPTRWAPYGLRRVAVDPKGCPVRQLETGEPNLRGCRVTLVPGPPHEVALVERVFRLFGRLGWSMTRIAETLNEEGVVHPDARGWDQGTVRRVLGCEAYIGDYVYGRTTQRLNGRRRTLPREDWTIANGVFKPIISRKLFDATQQRLTRYAHPTHADLLAALAALYAEHGYLDHRLIKATRGVPNPATYSKHFGGLVEAYQRIGYFPRSAMQAAHFERLMSGNRERLAADAIAVLREAGHRAVVEGRDVRVIVDDELAIDMRVCLPTVANGHRFWRVRTRRRARGQLMLVARLDEAKARVGYCLVARNCVQGPVGFNLPVDRPRDGFDPFTSLDGLYERCLRLLGWPALAADASA